MRRTLLLFILIFALAVGTPVHAATELPLLKAEVTSNVTWELQGTTLVFSGTGEIGETGGWEALRDTVTAIVIRSGITGIGARAFVGFKSLSELSLPETLVSIGSYAFSGCKSLKELTLPGNLTAIGSYAFQNTGIKTLTVPGGVSSVKAGTFAGCVDLTEVTLSGGITAVGDSAFSGCVNLQALSFPDTLAQIGYEAFAG